jgi:hypothetical protein
VKLALLGSSRQAAHGASIQDELSLPIRILASMLASISCCLKYASTWWLELGRPHVCCAPRINGVAAKMPIVFRCQHCGAPFGAPDALAGKQARCQGCRGTVTVPMGSMLLPRTAPVAMQSYAPGAGSLQQLPGGPDPLLYSNGLQPMGRTGESGLPAKWIVGGGVGIACAIVTFSLVTFFMSGDQDQPTSGATAAAPSGGGFVTQQSSPADENQNRSAFEQAMRGSIQSWVSPSNPPPHSGNSEASQAASSSARRAASSSGAPDAASNPFVPLSGSTTTAGSSRVPRVTAGSTELMPVSSPSVDLASNAPRSGWTVQPDPSPNTIEIKNGTIKIPLSGEQPQLVFPQGQSRFVLAWNGNNSRPECTLFDLKTAQPIGKKLELFGFQTKTGLVSEDGRYVGAYRKDEGSEQDRVRISLVSFATGQPLPRIEVKCNEFYKAVFGASHRLVTAHAMGRKYSSNQTAKLTQWDVQTGKSLGEIDLDALDVGKDAKLENLVISPGGKYVAYPLQNELIFVELDGGKLLERLPLSKEFRDEPRLSFSPDGTLLACVGNMRFNNQLRVIDLSTGALIINQKVESDNYSADWRQGEICWLPGNVGLLIDGQLMLELTSAKEAWNFPRSRGEPRRILRAGEMITLGADRNRHYLYSVSLPEKRIAQVFIGLREGEPIGNAKETTTINAVPSAETPSL